MVDRDMPSFFAWGQDGSTLHSAAEFLNFSYDKAGVTPRKTPIHTLYSHIYAENPLEGSAVQDATPLTEGKPSRVEPPRWGT